MLPPPYLFIVFAAIIKNGMPIVEVTTGKALQICNNYGTLQPSAKQEAGQNCFTISTLDSNAYLDLSEKGLLSLQPGVLNTVDWIEIVNISSNNFVTTGFLGSLPISSVTIDAKYNKIDIILPIDLEIFLRLESIYLDGNRIKKLGADTLSNVPKLRVLSLVGNLINNIQSIFFKDMESLTHLNLTNNKLSDLTPNVFSNLKIIEDIRLEKNELSVADSYIFHEFKQLLGRFEIQFDRLSVTGNRVEILGKTSHTSAASVVPCSINITISGVHGKLEPFW